MTGSFVARTYDELVRDLLTTLTGGTATEAHPVPPAGLPELTFDAKPVRRVSHVKGEVLVGDETVPYRFTERDFELVPAATSTATSPAFDGLRFGTGPTPAPNTTVTVNYYPVRLLPTPINDVNVGSVARTLLETVARELATQYQQLQFVYDSGFVGFATGSGLDNVAALVDVSRLKARHPVGQVRLSRRPGSAGAVTIPVDTAVTDGTGNRYLTTDPATMLPGQSTVDVWVHGESPATAPVEAGVLTVLERAIAGVDRVTNTQATFRATEDETDDQLRGRAKVAIHGTGRGTLDAIRSGLEALEFVSAVNLTEMPDGVPGTLRVDVALTDDTAFNRSLVTRRTDELRPAGILVITGYAGKLDLDIEVGLTLAGAFEPDSVVTEITDGVRTRLDTEVRGLAPGATLRRSRLTAAALGDARVVDATVGLIADGAPVTADTFAIPADKAVQLDPVTDITFLPVQYEGAATTGPALVPVDVRLTVTLLDAATTLDVARSRITTVLGPALGGEAPLSTDMVGTALAAETAFAATAAETVLAVEHLPGEFTEVRAGDPPFPAPGGGTFELRDVTLVESV